MSWRKDIDRWPAAHRDAFEERAAIREVMAGEPRARAEFEAYRDQRDEIAAEMKRGAV